MENNDKLISKKELLARYGISYGSLYRWKRKGLIPDEWFIRKATVTGQETFFNESQICERIERILSTKEDTLLDELAATLSGEVGNDRTLVVETSFGTHRYRFSDIRRILISGRDGSEKNFTKEITDEIMNEITNEIKNQSVGDQ